MNSLQIANGASLWYPIMLAQESGEISEAKAAELLGMNLIEYRTHKENAILVVIRLTKELKSPLCSLLDAIVARPEWFAPTLSASGSDGERKRETSSSANKTS